MKWVATVLLVLVAGLGVAQSAEKPDAAKGRPAATKQKPADADSGPKTEFKKPEIELPGGMKGTFGTIEAPKDPHRPGYTGPATDSVPSLPAGGLILKKEF